MNETGFGDIEPDSLGFFLYSLLAQSGDLDMGSIWIPMLLFLAASFFFSLAEGALLAYSPARLQERFGPGHDTLMDTYIEHRDAMVVSSIIFDSASNVGFIVCATVWIMQVWTIGGALGVITSVMVGVGVLLPIGELFPRSWGHKNSTAVLYRTLALHYRLSRIMLPFINGINAFNHFLLRGLGRTEADSATMLVDEIQSIVDKGEQQGLLNEEDREMIESVIEFSDVDVREIMTPRTDMVCIAADATLDEAVIMIMEEQHSRMPVYEDTRDTIVGLLYAKDMFPHWHDSEGKTVRSIMRPPLFVPETKLARELFDEMRNHKTQVAIILDEYGGTDGLVTIEDILEEIVGDIADEYDELDSEYSLNRIDEFTAEVDGQYPLDEFAEEMVVHIPENDHYETIGGFLFSEMGRIPKTGDEYTFENISFRILNASARRINKIHVTVSPNGNGDHTP